MIRNPEIRKAIKDALRKPDCGHNHTSYPEADIDAIVNSLGRAGYRITNSPTLMPESQEELNLR